MDSTELPASLRMPELLHMTADQFFRLMSDHSLETSLLTAPDGRVLAANPAACETFGGTERELCTLSAAGGRSSLADTDDPRLAPLLAQRLAVGHARGELRLRRMDGELFDAEVSSFLFLERGFETTTILKVRDLSALRLAERRAQESESRMEFALDAAQIGDWNMDLRTNVAQRSLRHDQCFGYAAPVEAWGYETFLAHVHPEHRLRVAACYSKAMAGEGKYDVDFPVIWPDGSTHWLRSKGRFYFDAAGAPYRVAGIQVDITKHHTADAALRQSEERLELVLKGSRDAPWDLDLQTNTPYFSPGWLDMLGHPADQPPSEAAFWSQAWHPEDAERIKATVEAALAGSQETYEIDYRLRHSDGHYVPVRSRAYVVRDSNGKAIRVAGVNTDLTEQHKLQEAQQQQAVAEAANASKTHFISRMSHELRTPLNAILGFTQLMLDDEQLPLQAAQRQRAARVNDAGRHLNFLIGDLLDISRIETGQLSVALAPVDLRLVLQEVLEILAPQSQAARVQMQPVEQALPLPLPLVSADATRLRQVLFNLLTNAIKYNRPGGKVWCEAALEATPDGERLVLQVCDSGLGMNDQQMAHLYEPYNRLGRESHPADGIGIGLSVTRALLQLMGATLEASSVLGTGSSFRISLPVADAAAATAEARVSGFDELTDDEPRGVVLSIEDNPVNQLLVEAQLARWPQVRLLQATLGEEGLAMIRGHRPDLVLLDMNLPDISGLEVLAQLGAEMALGSVKVVMLSADAMADDMEASLAMGAVDYLTKPVELSHFLSRVVLHLRTPDA